MAHRTARLIFDLFIAAQFFIFRLWQRPRSLFDFCALPIVFAGSIFRPLGFLSFTLDFLPHPVTLEYNTARPILPVPEYGRAIQEMANYLLTIEDPEKRLQQASIVIESMSALNPALKGVEDYKHILWDHLWQMTDGKLDVEGPFPPPTPQEEAAPLVKLSYPQTKLRHRHLGRKFDEVLKQALEEIDPEKKQAFTQTLGYFMKLAYAGWMKENPSDEQIRTELSNLSDGALQYEPGGGRIYFNPAAQQGGSGRNNRGSRGYKGGGRGFGGAQAGGGAQKSAGSSGGGKKFYRNKKG